jgi:hypothetical protein
MYIPIIVDHQEEINFNDGRKKERNEPEKVMTVSVHFNDKNMNVINNVFSGILVSQLGAATDEVITYTGKVAKDKKSLEYIEITKESTVFRLDTREDIEKTTSLVVRFENIPFASWGGFKYKDGISKIASVKYNEEYTIPRYGYVNSYTEKFVKIDESKIGGYYCGVKANFTPGNTNLDLKKDPKIAVVNMTNEKMMNGLADLFINELMKHKGIMVLERIKIHKIIDEIELSKSGLVNPDTEVKDGRILNPDVEIILTTEKRNPEDVNIPFKSFVIRSKIRIVKTGQVIDPNFTFLVDKDKGMGFDGEFDSYMKRVTGLGIHYLYE